MYIKYINHLEQINDAALTRPQVMIDEVEDSYREHIRNIARNIVTHYGTAKICMLAGPSASGKTTTAHFLQRYLAEFGIHAMIVSMDDFYLGQELKGLTYDLDEYAGLVDMVELEDVVEIAKSVELDTVYFLKNRGEAV